MFTTFTSVRAELLAISENFATGIPLSETSVTTAPAEAGVDNTKRNGLVINLMLVATFVVFLNETIISVAVPAVMADLKIPASTAQWLSTAFMLTMAVVIPTTGFLMQRLNTRTVFILAMSLFTAGTAIAAMAPGFEILLAGRVVQASGTAIMMPLLMTTVMTLVPPHARGKTMGNISIVMSVAPALGPAIGGAIVQGLHWRFIFIIVLPIPIAALVRGALRVKTVPEPRAVPLDVLSVILSAFAFGGLIYGLSSLGEAAAGTAPISPWIPLVVGGASLVLFIVRQLVLQKGDRAFLDLRTFTSRGFTVAIVLMVVMMGALFGTVFLLPIYTQKVLGLEPALSGLILVPGSLLMGVAGPFIGRLYDKVGPRVLIVPGAVVVSAALWGFYLLLGEGTPWGVVLGLHVFLSLGLAFMFTPLFTSSMASLNPRLYSYGSATIATTQQLAGAAGTALFVALFTIGTLSVGSNPDGVAAEAVGVHNAFMAGAIISLLAIVAAFFVPKPVEFEHPEGADAGFGGH